MDLPPLFIPTTERTASELAADFAARGMVLMTFEGRLFISESTRLTPEDRAAIKTHRSELFQFARVLTRKTEHQDTPPVEAPVNTSNVSLGEYLGLAPVAGPRWQAQEPPNLDAANNVVINFETDGLEWWKDSEPIGVTVGTLDGAIQRYLPYAHPGGGNLDKNAVITYLQHFRNKHILNANTKFDVHMGRKIGVDFEAQGCTVSDIQHTAALLDDNRKKFALDILAKDYLGGLEVGRLDERNMAQYQAFEVGPRAEYQAKLVAQLREKMWPLIEKEDLERVHKLEDEIIYPVCEMERNAMPIDRPLLKQWVKEIEQLQHQCLWEIAKEVHFTVNPDSPNDMVRLFNHFNIPIEGMTESGKPSFTDKILKHVDNKFIQLARKAGKLASLNSKFYKAYDDVVGDDSLLRYSLHQLRVDDHGTVRGRFSASDKNIQQVMNADTHMESFGNLDYYARKLFIAGEGEVLSADAAQIEFRIFAHHAESERIYEEYRKNPEVSFHRIAEGMVRPFRSDLPYTKIKSMNFLFIYGGGKSHLGEFLEISQEQANIFAEIYHKAFPEVKTVLKKAETVAKSRGYVKSLMGRRARLDSKHAYKAWNAVAQPSAADIFKVKTVELHRAKKHTGFLMRAPVHDEMVGDALNGPETAERVREILNEQSFKLRVQILWNVKTGKTWADCK